MMYDHNYNNVVLLIKNSTDEYFRKQRYRAASVPHIF